MPYITHMYAQQVCAISRNYASPTKTMTNGCGDSRSMKGKLSSHISLTDSDCHEPRFNLKSKFLNVSVLTRGKWISAWPSGQVAQQLRDLALPRLDVHALPYRAALPGSPGPPTLRLRLAALAGPPNS